MSSFTQRKLFVDGPAGRLETVVAEPGPDRPRAIAVIAHPHPLYDGTMNNKVVYTLFKSFLELGLIAVRFNFRGVEQSGGMLAGKDDGAEEVEDVIAIAETIGKQFAPRFEQSVPLWLAGFSFGGAVQAHAARKLRPEAVVMVAPAVERLHAPHLVLRNGEEAEAVPRVLIVHGDQDKVVPLETVLNWAAPQELPVVVVPGAEHFFHRRLHILKRILLDTFRP